SLLRGTAAFAGGMAITGLVAACGDDDDDDDDAAAEPTEPPAADGEEPTEEPAEGETPEEDGEETPAEDEEEDGEDREGQPGGTLVIAFDADPESLDPHITTALLASRVLAFQHDNLINRDYDGTYVPELAES